MESASHKPKPITAGSLAFFLIIGFGLLALFWFGTKALRGYVQHEPGYEERRSVERIQIRDKVFEQANHDLTQYAWKNREQGIVQIPVERAMELTVAALQKHNEIRPAGFVDPLKAAAAASQAAAPPAPEETPVPVPSPELAEPVTAAQEPAIPAEPAPEPAPQENSAVEALPDSNSPAMP